MSIQDSIISNISIHSASEVDTKLLVEFYRNVYPRRELYKVWRWLYRVDYNKKRNPIVVLYKEKIIAHAGMIPVHVWVNGTKYSASWFVDLIVLPEYRRMGLGSKLTDEWIKFSDMNITLGPNEKSLGLFRKMGCAETNDTYLHYLFIKPLDHQYFSRIPSILRKMGNILFRPICRFINRGNSSYLDHLKMSDIDDSILESFNKNLDKDNGIVVPVRDIDYIGWRLLDSPTMSNYRIVQIDSFSRTKLLIKLTTNEGIKVIDMMMIMGDRDPKNISKTISTMMLWGLKNDYSYIRLFTSEKLLSERIKTDLRSIVRHPYFCYYSKDKKLFEGIKKLSWNWELIDSDNERF